MSTRGVLRLRARFEAGTTITVGSTVRGYGLPLGEVTDVDAFPDSTCVTFRVRDDFPILTSATVSLRPSMTLGEFYVDLDGGEPRLVGTDGRVVEHRRVSDGAEISAVDFNDEFLRQIQQLLTSPRPFPAAPPL